MPHEGFKGIKWSSQKQAMVDFCGSKNIGNFNKAILSEGFKKKIFSGIKLEISS